MHCSARRWAARRPSCSRLATTGSIATRGVAVDVSRFKELVLRGDVYERQAQPALAADYYTQAVHLYSGDLAGGEGAAVLLERDRLRAVHLGLLMRLSNYHFAQGDLSAALGYATELLAYDAVSRRRASHGHALPRAPRRARSGVATLPYGALNFAG